MHTSKKAVGLLQIVKLSWMKLTHTLKSKVEKLIFKFHNKHYSKSKTKIIKQCKGVVSWFVFFCCVVTIHVVAIPLNRDFLQLFHTFVHISFIFQRQHRPYLNLVIYWTCSVQKLYLVGLFYPVISESDPGR